MSTPSVLVPVESRVRWLAALRGTLLVALVVLVVVPQPQAIAATWSTLRALLLVVGLAGGAWIVSTVVAAWTLRRGRRLTLAVIGYSLTLDGVVLVWALALLGGLQGAVPLLVGLHVVAVTLLMSFRTGLRAVVWHLGLIALVVVLADQDAVLAAVPQAVALATTPQRFAGVAVILLATALLTAAVSAVNERELRRRRYDAEVLQELAIRLRRARSTDAVLTELAQCLVRDLGAPAALAVVDRPDHGPVAVASRDDGVPSIVPVPDGTSARLPEVADLDDDGSRARIVHASGWATDHLRSARPDTLVLALNFGEGLTGSVLLTAPSGPFGRSPRRLARHLVSAARTAVDHAAMTIGVVQALDRLEKAAHQDALTGIDNRRRFESRLAGLLDDAVAPLSVALVDLDHFKQVNDTHGHQVGDEVLVAAARTLAEVAGRSGAWVARIGGEEFAAVVPGTASVAREVVEAMREAVTVCDAPVRVTASVGVTAVHAGERMSQVLSRADGALYRAKHEGRNCVRVAVDAVEPGQSGPVATAPAGDAGATAAVADL